MSGGGVLILLGVELFLCALCVLVLGPDRAVVGTVSPEDEAGASKSSPKGRALDLLKAVLNEREYKHLMTCGFLDVHSPTVAGRVYRVNRFGGMVSVFEHGRSTRELCVQPAEPLPAGDVVALHKLLIEADEEHYIQTAKSYPSLTPGRRYRP